MAWSKQLSQLRDALAYLIPFREDALVYLTEADVNWRNINLNGPPSTMWFNALKSIDGSPKTNELVDVLLIHFPGNPHLLSFKESLKYSLGPDVNTLDWKSNATPAAAPTLEKIIGTASTLLPISFLQVGIKRAKSVARILVKKPAGTEAGTGFRLKNNFILTNNHVLPDINTAALAKVQFNYEESENGLPLESIEFELDPANGFATSVEDDWTVVCIKGDNDTLSAFGHIELKKTTVSKDDFVNIIQHPGGRYKQIGMYHNVVTYSDNDIVQYLTDTEAGSSGSPVFNSKWELVALHHSGGMLKEPGNKQNLLRNEGIHINKVMDGLTASNIVIS